ncbi:MAG: helix-turn-helix domain-containing protein [Christensenellales bacterium]
MDKKKVIARIEQLRIEKGISVYQLKENADISSTIYQWKKNATRDRNRTPSLRSIEKICDYLGVSLSYFFAFDEDTQTDVKNKELTEAIKKLNKEQIHVLELLIKEFNKN